MGHSDLKTWMSKALVMVAVMTLAAGCLTDDTPTDPGQGAGSIALSVTPASASIAQGGSQTVVGTLTRSGSFTGNISLTVTGIPTGVTAVVSNPVTSGRVTTADITIQVGAATALGVYNLVARGQGSGVADATANFTLTVTGAAAPAFTFTLSTGTATIPPGGNAPITVNIARTNFTGGVTLALEGAPAGVTGVFNPNPATGASSTLTISVGAGVAAGTHTLTVRASATGLPDQTATITLTISASTYTLTLSSNAVTVAPGGNQAITVNLARTNFTGGVTLALEGAPAGVTGVFVPNPATGTSSTLTITVAAGTAAGTHTLTVRGTATGQADQTATITLTISAAASYTLSLNPAALPVVQGGTGTITVDIARSNFTGDVTLSLGGAPANVTGVFNPNPATGTSSTLTVTVGASVTPGVYNLTVDGTSSAGNRSTPLTLTVTAAADYQLSLTPAALPIAQGATGTSTVNIARTNFTGDVTLSLGGAPANVTGVFNPNPATGNSSVLTVTVGAGVAAGVYNLTVNGTGTPGARSTPLTLTVTAVTAADYSLSATSVTVAQGGTGTSTVTITRTNFTGDVTLSLGGAPANVTGSFNPNPASGSSSTLTITVGAGVAAGVYNLTVNGAATPGARSTPLTLTVSTSGGSGNVTLNYSACPVPQRPVWVAFQDGGPGTTNPWIRVIGSGDIYSFTVTSGKFGLAQVFLPTTSASNVQVQYQTTAEFSGVINFCPTIQPPPPLKTINGVVAGVDATQEARIALNSGFAIVNTSFPTFPNFTMDSSVLSGVYDLIGYRGALAFGITTTDRAIIRRDQNIPDNGSVGTMDFNGSESFAVASATISVGGVVGGETVSAFMSYQTGSSCTGTSALLYALQNVGSSFTATGIPSSAPQRASDFHNLSIQAGVGSSSIRSVSESFNTFGARTITLGGQLNPTITQLAGPYKRLQAVYTLPSEYNFSTFFGYDDNAGKSVSITATLAYLGSTSVTLALPDFTPTGGFDNNWPPASGSTVDWNVGAIGGTGTFCTDNARTFFVVRTGSFTAR